MCFATVFENTIEKSNPRSIEIVQAIKDMNTYPVGDRKIK
jgi:hypothetical protein